MDNQGAELDRLRRWKAEATEVILGLQDVAKALGLQLGERITGKSAADAANRLTERAEAAEAALARVEALPEHPREPPDVRRTPDGAPVYPADARQELADELTGLALTPLEAQVVMWLYELDQPTLHGITTLLRKVREDGLEGLAS
jgi:hypothetical protein